MWSKYPSIENSYKEKFIEYCKSMLLKPENHDITFYITEKIHGCNISFHFDKVEQEMTIFSRNQRIDEAAFGLDKVLKRDNILQILHELIEQKYNTANEITFYGEYFGGFYNKESDGKKVQNIEYCSENKIMFFDIKVDDEFENFEKVIETFSQHPKLLIPILKCNLSFNDALKYPNRYETIVPNILENKNKKDQECICEGNIIRPSRELKIGLHRFILKNKNETHSDYKLDTKDHSKDTLKQTYNIEKVETYLTPARVESAKSKLMLEYNGEIPTNILMREVINDIINDYIKDAGQENVCKDEIKFYKKRLGGVVYHTIAKLSYPHLAT